MKIKQYCTASGKDILDEKEKALAKSYPEQLSMFQTFLPEVDKYSNTIDFYDAMPKYYTNKAQLAKMRVGEMFLRTFEREFRYKDSNYILKIKPARVENKDGTELEYYPSEQEELVEEALRKIACDQLSGVYLDNTVGVQFTMYELREELRKRGHAMSHDEIKRSLYICRGAGLRVEGQGGDVEMESSIFPTVIISNRKEWKKDPKNTFCYVQFNPLVTRSLERMSYRQFDYVTHMSYKYQLSRWFHKRLYHRFTQASIFEKYGILYSTIKRDSGLLNNNRISKDIQYIERTFDELTENNIINGFEKTIRHGKRNKIEDVKYELLPSMEFIGEMKKANKRAATKPTRVKR